MSSFRQQVLKLDICIYPNFFNRIHFETILPAQNPKGRQKPEVQGKNWDYLAKHKKISSPVRLIYLKDGVAKSLEISFADPSGEFRKCKIRVYGQKLKSKIFLGFKRIFAQKNRPGFHPKAVCRKLDQLHCF